MSILDDLHAEMSDKLLRLRGKIGGYEADLVEARAKLTDRQRKFCDLCWGDLPAYGQAIRAARGAGYRTPTSEGSRQVSMPKVRAVLVIEAALKMARRDAAGVERELAWVEAERVRGERELERSNLAFEAWIQGRFRGPRPPLPGGRIRRRRKVNRCGVSR